MQSSHGQDLNLQPPDCNSGTLPLVHHSSYTCINVVSVCACRPGESLEELANAPAPLATVLNDKAKMDTEVSPVLLLLLLKSSLSVSPF